MADLSQRFKVFHFSVEVSVRGQILKDNRCRVKEFIFRSCTNPGKLAKRVVHCASKAALLSSYSVFSARKEPSWNNPPLLIVS